MATLLGAPDEARLVCLEPRQSVALVRRIFTLGIKALRSLSASQRQDIVKRMILLHH